MFKNFKLTLLLKFSTGLKMLNMILRYFHTNLKLKTPKIVESPDLLTNLSENRSNFKLYSPFQVKGEGGGTLN